MLDILLKCSKEKLVYELISNHSTNGDGYTTQLRIKKVSEDDPDYVLADAVFTLHITNEEYKQMLRKIKLEKCVK